MFLVCYCIILTALIFICFDAKRVKCLHIILIFTFILAILGIILGCIYYYFYVKEVGHLSLMTSFRNLINKDCFENQNINKALQEVIDYNDKII